jgi:hypothetical protein
MTAGWLELSEPERQQVTPATLAELATGAFRGSLTALAVGSS